MVLPRPRTIDITGRRALAASSRVHPLPSVQAHLVVALRMCRTATVAPHRRAEFGGTIVSVSSPFILMPRRLSSMRRAKRMTLQYGGRTLLRSRTKALGSLLRALPLDEAEDARTNRQRPGDERTLALATGDLVGVAPDHAAWQADKRSSERLRRPTYASRTSRPPAGAYRLLRAAGVKRPGAGPVDGATTRAAWTSAVGHHRR